MVEDGLSFDNALKIKYDKQGEQTDSGLLLCTRCMEANNTFSYYKVVRPFNFYGDMSKNSQYVAGIGCYDKTKPDMFII